MASHHVYQTCFYGPVSWSLSGSQESQLGQTVACFCVFWWVLWLWAPHEPCCLLKGCSG